MASERVSTIAKHLSLTQLSKPNLSRPNRACNTLDSYLAYLMRQGPKYDGAKCIVFLHGNPANSYLWRNIVKQVEPNLPEYRLYCPDLIGHGRSGESSKGYDFFAHFEYLSSWFTQVVKEPNVFLCLHDWGSALGFHYLASNPQHNVKGLVHMESIVGPIETWEEFPKGGRKVFQTMREDKAGGGETMVLEKNFFVERLLLGEPWASKLDPEDVQVYRERFSSPATRSPTLNWPRNIPIKGTDGPTKVVEAATNWSNYLSTSTMPKLFIPASPGFFTPLILEKTKTWKNHKVASPAVKGIHFIQEDSPNEIAKFLVDFVTAV